jgi:predicted O-linked N-acetylglucosamine transferase (SPINDLY family)
LGSGDKAIQAIQERLAMASTDKLFARAQQAHRAGDAPEAMRLYRDVLRVAPQHLDACYLLGTLQATCGDLAAAAMTLQQAAAIEPRSAQVRTNLGLVLKMLGDAEQAEILFRQALAIDADLPQAANNLAALLVDRGRPVEAEAFARRAANSGPDAAAYALVQLANAQAAQARVADAIGSLRLLLQREPDHRVGWGNFLSFLQYDASQTREQIFGSHCLRSRRFAPASRPTLAARPDGKLRIGYLSPDFLGHPVGALIEPVIAGHDSRRFEVFLYSDTESSDALTERLRGVPGVVWRDVLKLSDSAVAERIRADGIDILIELAGHLIGNRLPMLAKRVAPVQVSYLGYPGSTGLAAIDYAISDAVFDPPEEANDWYAEHLIRLDRPAFCYTPPVDAPGIEAAPAAKPIRFGAFNTLQKINDEVIGVWARILAAVPDSVLVMQAKGLGDESLRRSLGERFGSHGVGADRLEFHPFGSLREHQLLVSGTHLCLDPWPWNGHMTTLNCLWMGVPVISMAGDRRATRMGKCILSAVGLEDFVADSPERYVALALAKAAAADELLALRGSLRRRLQESPLTDARGMVEALEAAYLKMLPANEVVR